MALSEYNKAQEGTGAEGDKEGPEGKEKKNTLSQSPMRQVVDY